MAYSVGAYATAQEYRDRNGRVSTVDDATLDFQLALASRVYDRRVRVAPGMMAPQTETAFIFPAIGGTRLRLRDGQGWQYLLRTVQSDKIEIDGGDGTYGEYALDLSDAWVKGYPRNSATFGEPFTSLDLIPKVANAAPQRWPESLTAVRITGDWGWATTPGVVKERVISIVRELVDVHKMGHVQSVSAMSEAIETVPSARSLMALIEQDYRYKVPASV